MPGTLESILLRHCGLQKDRPILVGVSGGADSLCLLATLHEAGWQVIAAHFNHMLRAEAAQDAAAVELMAGRLGISFVVGAGDVRQYAAEKKLSIESAGRDLRYRFLFAQAHAQQAQAVAVGHTADDQVETVLLHFVRGAGLKGLKGMPYRTILQDYDTLIPLIRPLLDLWRADTLAYCEAHGLEARYDASNDSLDFLRNRVRHELIPALETYNPRFRETLWRSSRTFAADHELISRLLEPIWQKAVVRQTARYVALRLGILTAEPAGVQMHLVSRAVQWLLPGYDTGFADLQRAVDFLSEADSDRADLVGGLFLLREGDVLFLTADEAVLPYDQWPQMPPGSDAMCCSSASEVPLADGWQFTCDTRNRSDLGSQPWRQVDPFQAFLDASVLPNQLELRVRRDTDRFEPLGLNGHSQKLSDFFINAKLPVRARDRWPLVCMGDQVIWVPGYRPSDRYRLRDDSTRVLCLSIIPPERSAAAAAS